MVRTLITPTATRSLGLLAASLLLAACSGSSSRESGDTSQPAPGRTTEITIEQFQFDPPVVTIEAGATVQWTNADRILHTATSGTATMADGVFSFDLDDRGSTATMSFDSAGVYEYFCAIHPHMTGTIIVEATS